LTRVSLHGAWEKKSGSFFIPILLALEQLGSQTVLAHQLVEIRAMAASYACGAGNIAIGGAEQIFQIAALKGCFGIL
jgi:hypothetical protein